MPDGPDAAVECPPCEAAFGPSIPGGWCTDPERGARHVAGRASPGRRLVADGGQTRETRTDDRPGAAVADTRRA